ncbi:hypothetical protein CIPAW_11G070900 [Carya illinoinensis]|uniref:Uncharacterized protein n=1 Tax=Carya illinoinensis TaxID=32201 RepID=A0A8T1P1U6_CARIL|nr:hypothetical protein CIPAW_11G070900 [Carya illinoinensis]
MRPTPRERKKKRKEKEKKKKEEEGGGGGKEEEEEEREEEEEEEVEGGGEGQGTCSSPRWGSGGSFWIFPSACQVCLPPPPPPPPPPPGMYLRRAKLRQRFHPSHELSDDDDLEVRPCASSHGSISRFSRGSGRHIFEEREAEEEGLNPSLSLGVASPSSSARAKGS